MDEQRDDEGRLVIKTQKEFFEHCVDENKNIDADNVRLRFNLYLSRKGFYEDYGEVSFKNALFEKDVNFKNVTFLGDTEFLDTTFLEGADFTGATFSGLASFVRAKFKGQADFAEASFLGDADFAEARFLSSAEFIKAIFKRADFFEAEFLGDREFLEGAFFIEATFKENADFFRVIFSGHADFKGAKFSSTSFYGTMFKREAVFEESTFSDDVNFTSVTFLLANFSKAAFSKTADFLDTVFSRANFRQTEFNLLMLSGAIFSEYVQFKEAFIKNADRETFRIIKHEFLKINNRIEALEYHKREMKAYWKELFGTKMKKRPRKKWKISYLRFSKKINKKKIPEKVILLFNRISTNYGLNWLQGVSFTLLATVFFYSIFLILSNSPDWSFEAYFRFLNPAHSYEFLNGFNPYDSAFIIDAFGRVFIGYGYYQTIQAFRKYKRI